MLSGLPGIAYKVGREEDQKLQRRQSKIELPPRSAIFTHTSRMSLQPHLYICRDAELEDLASALLPVGNFQEACSVASYIKNKPLYRAVLDRILNADAAYRAAKGDA